MKKIAFVFSIVFLVALIITTSAWADLPGTGWWSGLFVQNIGGDSGVVQMTAYDSQSSSIFGSEKFSFDYGQALIYDPGKTAGYPANNYIGFSPSLPQGFEGSVVLEASVPIAAVSELANYRNGGVGVTGGTAAARYQGMSSEAVDTTLSVPTIKNNFVGQTTTVFVQAAGQDASVTIVYNMANGASFDQTVAIEANRMYMFDPGTAGVPSSGCGFDGNTSPCHGSAVITSTTGQIAAIVVEHAHQGSPAGFALSTRAQTSSDQDTILYHPTTKNNFWGHMDAGATIMNVGTGPALVRITLSVTNVDRNSSAQIGETFVDYEEIQPGESAVFSRWRNNMGGMPEGTFAAAVVESITGPVPGFPDTYELQNLVGSTNDRKVMPNVTGGLGLTLYAGFADQNKTNHISAPIVRERVDGITSGITVQNVGDAPANMTFYYYEYGTDNVYTFETKDPVAVGKATVTTLLSQQGADRFNIVDGFSSWSELNNKQFSVIVSSDQPIIGLNSEYAIADNRDMANYETINLQSIP